MVWQVAINWCISKGTIPIPGVKSVKQANENLGALGWELTSEEINQLENAALESPRRMIQNVFQTRWRNQVLLWCFDILEVFFLFLLFPPYLVPNFLLFFNSSFGEDLHNNFCFDSFLSIESVIIFVTSWIKKESGSSREVLDTRNLMEIAASFLQHSGFRDGGGCKWGRTWYFLLLRV